MPPSELTRPSTHPHRRIVWLTMVHLAVGLAAAFVAYFADRGPTLPGAVFGGTVFSQTSLLGIWGVLGSDSWWRRLSGALLGVGYLGTLTGVVGSDLDPTVYFIVVLATMFVALPLLIVRLFKIAIRPDSVPDAAAGRIQFSIRDLMLLTFVVACLTTIGKWGQPYFPHGEILFQVLLLLIAFAGVGVLPVWFILATKQPVLYSVGLVAVGGGAGYCLARILHRADEGGCFLVLTATEAMGVAVSLLVIRSCGYRLVRLGSSCTGDRSAR
jgi:hypothetical protein